MRILFDSYYKTAHTFVLLIENKKGTQKTTKDYRKGKGDHQKIKNQVEKKKFFKLELHIAIKGVIMKKNPTTVMEDVQQEGFENVDKMENEMNGIFNKKVNEQIEK